MLKPCRPLPDNPLRSGNHLPRLGFRRLPLSRRHNGLMTSRHHFRGMKAKSFGVKVDDFSIGLRLLAIFGLGVSILLVAVGQFWVGALGNISPVSIGAVCGLYVLADRRFEKDGVSRGQSIILAVLFANAFVQSFEVIYHFTFPVYLNYLKPPFLNGDDIRYLALEGVMLLPALLVRKHLRFGFLSTLLISFFAFGWVLWVLYGFPQYFAEGLFYPQILPASDPYHLSLLLNFGLKAILALFFASLLQRRIS